MSRINRIRIINLKYNHNRMCIDDEMFDLATESTLFSLRNGGGKSVLVQMLTAPFVAKGKRNTSERPFASYFTSDRPTFILVEWALDHEAGFVLTGMMVRKNQTLTDEDNDQELEILNFIHEYEVENEYDIQHLPVIVKDQNSKRIGSFTHCKNIFEKAKQNPALKFEVFDMNQYPKSKQYFAKLQEFQIYAKEWETIIKKVNLKESGLSELFKEAKDEKGLVEKWFLPTIEEKLNHEQNRMKESHKLLYKYIVQYKQNQSSYQRKEGILNFKETMEPIIDLEEKLRTNLQQIYGFESELNEMFHATKYLLETNKNQFADLETKALELKNQQRALAYEAASLEIYDLEDEVDIKEGQESWEEEIFEGLQKKREAFWHEANCLDASRLYGEYKEISEQVQQLEVELKLAKEKDKDLQPRLESLGYSLKLKLTEQVASLSNELINKQNEERSIQKETGFLQQELDGIRQGFESLIRKEAALTEKIQSFDQLEIDFNKQFSRHYQRNLSGNYELNFLEQEYVLLEQQLDQNKKDRFATSSLQQELKEKAHMLNRATDDAANEIGRLGSELKNASEKLSSLDEQAASRRQLLPYISWPEDQIYNKEGLVKAFRDKINDLKERLHQQRTRYEKEEEAYHKLKAGIVLELPECFSDFLSDKGIKPLLGMEWLKRSKQNRQLLKSNPFLPYSIILTELEFLKIKNEKQEIFTQFPIPILIREELEKGQKKSGFVDLENVHFYVYFNGDLLEEKQLVLILKEKEAQLDKLEHLKAQTEDALAQFTEKYEVISAQSLDEITYRSQSQEVERLTKQLSGTETRLQQLYSERKSNDEQISDAVQTFKKLQDNQFSLEKQIKALQTLKRGYEEFLEHHRQNSEVKEKRLKIEFLIKENEDKLEKNREQIIRQNTIIAELSAKLNQEKLKANHFEIYKEAPIIHKDTEDLKAEYNAIMEKSGSDVKNLQKRLDETNKTYRNREYDLVRHTEKAGLVDKDYKELNYVEYKRDALEKNIEALDSDIQKQEQKLRALEVEIAKLRTVVQTKRGYLLKEFQETALYPKTKIIRRSYPAEISSVQKRLDKVNEQIQKLNDYDQGLSRIQGILLEFESEKPEDLAMENFEPLTIKEWDERRKTVLRDLGQEKKHTGEFHQKIASSFRNLLQMDQFQDDFFKQPLQNLVKHGEQPALFFETYETISGAFQHQLGKYEVDIANVEREKGHVLEILKAYIFEVHQKLGKIDVNSTISHRGKSLKMLKISLPNWEDNSFQFEKRLSEFVDNLLLRCLAILEQNQNIEEEIARQLTTKQLYDTVVGTGTIGIQLHKIEEQREVKITWEQVAKNSGGEGFLSAFVILTSLLSFMRYDETNIFSKNEEGKVLLMDNPFAQTNAAHLLKPLMELAKKNNTQLICLSGLTGDSILGRFENIYSLSLMPSSIQKGTDYLKGEHIKNNIDEQMIIPSRLYIQEEEAIF